MHDYNFAQGLAIHTRFDDLDLISRSQVCQNHKLQIVFRFLSIVMHGATHIQQLKHSMLYVTGRYLRDITDMIFVILHLDASHLSVCFSCLD